MTHIASPTRFEEALNDAHLVTTLAPNWTPAYSRKAYVLWCMGEIGRGTPAPLHGVSIYLWLILSLL
jgi:hypothetical protein